MRKPAIILIVFACLVFGEIFSKEHKDDSYIIRRAYFDVLGTFPTIEELEWYCVYNTEGYKIAVDWLLSNPVYLRKSKGDTKALRELLMSPDYKEQVKTPISREDLVRVIFYFVREEYSAEPEKQRKAKLKFLACARAIAESDLDVIDVFANLLMSRSTRVTEANQLLTCLKNFRALASEDEAWLAVIEQVLKLEDVRSK
jgi:hypothetical protein